MKLFANVEQPQRQKMLPAEYGLHGRTTCLSFVLIALLANVTRADRPKLTFESDVRPVFASKCYSCHGAEAREANLDLRSIGAIRRGGDSGSAIEGQADSVLMQRIASREMPPEEHPALTKKEMQTIRGWIEGGAVAETTSTTDEWSERLEAGKTYWAFQTPKRPKVPGKVARSPRSKSPISEFGRSSRASLQAWYRAESISASDGEPVVLWLDESGNGRHLRPTAERIGAPNGMPPNFAMSSSIANRPAIRFDSGAGLGSPAENPVEITGDAAWTVSAVVSIGHKPRSHTSVIVGFGDPAPGHNPGRPWASLLEVHRDNALLSHSGGYGHDARMPAQTVSAFYGRPMVITVVKQPGSMAETTSLFVNGHQIPSGSLFGVATAPDIHHRSDFGIYLGNANGSLGSFHGDVAEVAIFNVALSDAERGALEEDWIAKYETDWPRVKVSRRSRSNLATRKLDRDDRFTVIHPIDAFLQRKLDEKGLAAAPRADRRTLIRRAYFDLVGLPPKPDEVDAFVNDILPFAWERVIGRLLESEHYGERWGRHWLDVARYADTGGYETDIYYRNAWRYRDYVVKSLNEDKPYDQFVQEQIAGDEIWPDNLDLNGSYSMAPEKLAHFEALTGTGLYALGPQIHESNMDAKKLANERLTDWVDTTGSAFMGLTFACARCHDHKFDPISQRDYYSLQAVFAGSREIEVEMQHGMGLADWKQHYPKVLALEEARMAYRDYESRTGGRERSPEEQKKLQDLKNTIADRLLQLPANDAQREPYAGVYERPTVTVLGPHRPELAPAVHLLSRGELGRAKQKMIGGLPEFLNTGRPGRPDSGEISR